MMVEKLRGVIDVVALPTFGLKVGVDWYGFRFAPLIVREECVKRVKGDVVEIEYEFGVSKSGERFKNIVGLKFIEHSAPSVPIGVSRDTRDAAYWKRHETQIVKQSCLKSAAAITARQPPALETVGVRTIRLAEEFKEWVMKDGN